jgi:hypothetical protein
MGHPRRLWSTVVLAVLLSHSPLLAQTLQLQRQGGEKTTTVVSRPEQPLAANQTLTVICDGFDCIEIQGRVVLPDGKQTVSELTPSNADPSKLGQRNFRLPEAKEGSKAQIWACAAGIPVATCKSGPPLVEIGYGTGVRVAVEPPRNDVIEFCATVGALQVNEIRSRRGGNQDFTVVVFDSTGPCYLSRQFGAEGDPIAIGFVSATVDTVSLDLDPCSTLAAAPKVLISADVSSLTFQSRTAGELRAEWFPPLRQCFGTAAGLKLSVTKEGRTQATALAYTLKQFDRYRATLQIGVAASELHQQTFGLRQDGSVKRIIETSADERGPEYIAALVLYGVPNYFVRRSAQAPCFYENPKQRNCPPNTKEPSQKENYFGRDPVNDNGVADRIGFLFAAGMNQPGRRFLIGGSFEIVTGINVFLTREFVRLPELEGVAVGDVFAGEAAALPIRDHWRQAWTAGVSLDARYALALFGRK